MSAGFVYGIEPNLSAAEFRRVLDASGLAARRPTEEERLEGMLRAADLIVTARAYTPERQLVGVARTLTDFTFCAYLSDLAVDHAHQGRGIGQALIARTREAVGPQASLLLTAAPAAIRYYERIGMPRIDCAFRYDRTS